MNTSVEILREQLQQLYQREELMFKHRATISNWCITVWVAVLAFLGTKYLALNTLQSLFTLFLTVFLFYLLDSIHGAFISLHIEQAIELEKRIAEENIVINDVSEIFMYSRYLKFSSGDKWKALIRSFFIKSSLIFYGSLIIASIFSVFIVVK